jgi:hypothetical protein
MLDAGIIFWDAVNCKVISGLIRQLVLQEELTHLFIFGVFAY